MTRHPNLGAAR